MRVFGYDVRLNVVKAAAPRLPVQNDSALVNILPDYSPFMSSPISPTEADLNERTVHADPREAWYLSLGVSKPTPMQVLQILRSASAGDLWQQDALVQLMLMHWPTFRMASHQLFEAAAYMRYAVHPFAEEGAKPSKRAMEKADLVSRAMRGFNPDPFNDEVGFSGMCYKLADALLNGIAVSELVWEYRQDSNHGREHLPRAAARVHPRHFSFTNDGRIAIHADNGARFQFAGAPELVSPDPDKFLCAQYLTNASSLNAGLARSLGWAFAARQFNLEWMLNTAKRYGAPFLDITYKPGKSSDAERDKMVAMAKDAASSRVLVHPEGTTCVIAPAHPLGKENPQRVLEEKSDDWCLFLLLGQKGTTVGTPGKLGSDDTFESTKDTRVMGLATWLARNPLRQFARAVLRRNYGEDTECPNIEPDATKPLKSGEVASLASAMTNSRIPVRADEAYKKLGFTQPEAGEVVLVGGALMVQGEALTDEEKFNQDLDKQVAQAEAARQFEQQQQSQDGEKAKAVQVKISDKTVRATLAKATDEELAELDKLITAAERAPHANGEVLAVHSKLSEMSGGRIKF